MIFLAFSFEQIMSLLRYIFDLNTHFTFSLLLYFLSCVLVLLSFKDNHSFSVCYFPEGDAEVCNEDCGFDARSKALLLARRSHNHAAGHMRILYFF